MNLSGPSRGRISVIGQGYVGLPLAIAAAESGFEVTGIDIDASRVASLNAGVSPVGDITNTAISSVIGAGKYRAVSEFNAVADSEIVIICVPTPLDDAHEPDISTLIAATKSVSEYLRDGVLVIIESTIAPGTTREIIAPLLGSSKKYDLAYSPERIDPSNTQWTIRNTPKLVAGISDQATDRAVNFYSTFIERVDKGSSIEVVEVAKLLENSFRLINISFINEIAIFCEKLGIDIREVIAAASTKPCSWPPPMPLPNVFPPAS